MKKFVIALCLLFFSSLPYAAQSSFNEKMLYETRWEMCSSKNIPAECVIELSSNGEIKVVESTYGFGESIMVFEGTIKWKGNGVVEMHYALFSEYDRMGSEGPDPNFKEPWKTVKGTVVEDPSACHFKYYLKMDDGKKFFAVKWLVPAGKKTLIDGITVETTGVKNTVTTDNVKIRIKPDVNAQSIKYCNSLENEATDFVPKGSKINLIARTIEKNKVNNWNNYWYYVELLSDGYASVRYAWMYGEFIKPQ